MIRLATDTFSKRLRVGRKKNKSVLCRYFSLLYDKDYASALVGANCDKLPSHTKS